MRRVELHTVRDPEVAVENAAVFEVVDLVASVLELAHCLALVSVLEGVGVDRPAVAGGEIVQLGPETVAARQDEARIEGVAQASGCRTIEGLAQGLGLGEHGVGVAAEAGRQFAGVHQTLAGTGAQTRLLQCPQQAACAGAETDLLNRGGAGQQALSGAEQRRPVGALVVVSGLERPDALAQPGQQLTLLGEVHETASGPGERGPG